jgi:hypothetical protein
MEEEMKKDIFFIILLNFVCLFAFSQNQQNFNKPEIVINYFVDNMKSGNFSNVMNLSPFNNDVLINKINPRDFINLMDTIQFHFDLNMPLQYHSIIKSLLIGRYATGIKAFIFYLLIFENYPELANSVPLKNVNDEIINKYFSLLNIENLKTLEIVRMDVIGPEIQFDERHMNYTLNSYIKPFGCDEKIEYTVLYKNNGKYYVGGVIVLRYGNNWYIESLSSVLLNMGNGILKRVSNINEYLYNYTY